MLALTATDSTAAPRGLGDRLLLETESCKLLSDAERLLLRRADSSVVPAG